MQTKLLALAEGATSYILAFFVLGFGALIENSGTLMTLGGLALLGLRLYVDSLNARKAYRQNKREAEYDAERGN